MTITNDTITTPKISFTQKNFEKLYISSRKQENRIYTDEQLAQLPMIDPSHEHYHEWQVRKRSATRLMNYLENKNKPLTVLEAGCGNGWLSAGLVKIKDSMIIATDINKTELEQGKRVFKSSNIHFIEGDIRNIVFEEKFDVIVFAASIQYFPSFNEIIRYALSILNKEGEIHIIDSYFYKAGEIENAKRRSLNFYRSIGCEEMAELYFHHSTGSLDLFNHTLLYDPGSLKNKLFGKKDPFPWICIKTR